MTGKEGSRKQIALVACPLNYSANQNEHSAKIIEKCQAWE